MVAFFGGKQAKQEADTATICIRGCKEGEKRSALSPDNKDGPSKDKSDPFLSRKTPRGDARELMLRIKPFEGRKTKVVSKTTSYFGPILFSRLPLTIFSLSSQSAVRPATTTINFFDSSRFE